MSKFKIDAPKFEKDKRELLSNIEKLDNELKFLMLNPNDFTNTKSNKIDFLKKDCETKIIMMRTDLNMIPNSESKKDELNKLVSKFDSVKVNYSKVTTLNRSESDHKDQAVNVSKSIKTGTKMMKEATQTLLSAEDDEKEVMTELIKHRNIMEEGDKKLDQADGYLMQSQRVIRSLYKKVITNKLILIALIVVLGMLNALLLYIRVKDKLGIH